MSVGISTMSEPKTHHLIAARSIRSPRRASRGGAPTGGCAALVRSPKPASSSRRSAASAQARSSNTPTTAVIAGPAAS